MTPPSDVVCLSHSTMFSWIWTNTVSEDFNRFHCLNADHVFLWYHAGWVCDLFTFQCVSCLRSRFSVYHVYVHVSVCITFMFTFQCVSCLRSCCSVYRGCEYSQLQIGCNRILRLPLGFFLKLSM